MAYRSTAFPDIMDLTSYSDTNAIGAHSDPTLGCQSTERVVPFSPTSCTTKFVPPKSVNLENLGKFCCTLRYFHEATALQN